VGMDQIFQLPVLFNCIDRKHVLFDKFYILYDMVYNIVFVVIFKLYVF